MSEQSRMDRVGGWPAVFSRLAAGGDLSRDEAYEVMSEILGGSASPAQIGGLLMALATKGESTNEMVGFVHAMYAASEPLTLPREAVDIVGTGGSKHRQSHAVNASTMACIVAGAAGAVICKHGNRKASSTSGSFDFLESLGVAIDLTPQQLEKCVAEVGVGFAFARAFHPAMRFAGPVRSDLGVPTVFNTLGPIAHPGRVKRQLIGVASVSKAEQVAGVLHELGSDRAWVVAGADGLDEVSTTGPSDVFDVSPEGIERTVVSLSELGIDRVELADLAGGGPEDNVSIFEGIVAGKDSPHRQLVLINAGAALVVAGLAANHRQGVAMAAEAVDSGGAGEKLEQLREFSG